MSTSHNTPAEQPSVLRRDIQDDDSNEVKDPAELLTEAHQRMQKQLVPLYNSMLKAGLVKRIQRLQLAAKRTSSVSSPSRTNKL